MAEGLFPGSHHSNDGGNPVGGPCCVREPTPYLPPEIRGRGDLIKIDIYLDLAYGQVYNLNNCLKCGFILDLYVKVF